MAFPLLVGTKFAGGLIKTALAGGVRRTLATKNLTGRLQPPPQIRPPLDTIMAGRIGPIGGALTRQRYGPPPVRQSPRAPSKRGVGIDVNGQEYLKPGYMVDRNGNVRKRPSMQVANPRAAVRALRRIRGFEKIARQIIKVTPKFKSKPTYRGMGRKRNCK